MFLCVVNRNSIVTGRYALGDREFR